MKKNMTGLRTWVYNSKQLDGSLSDSRISAVYAPMTLISEKYSEYSERIILLPPEFLADCEKKTESALVRLRELGFGQALAHTVGHIELLQRNGFIIHGGNRLNCTNSESAAFFAEQGLESIIVSPELTVKQINALERPIQTGIIAYGKLALMLNRRCPINDGRPCGKPNCGRHLTDRKGNRVDVICSENTVELLNSDVLMLSDRLGEFDADFAVLRFTVEQDVKNIIDMFENGSETGLNHITRGLYFRGVE